jgi:hypothetical protein
MVVVGKISGKIEVVTENSLKFASLDNRFFCKGANMQLPINKIGNWNADNKYVIELTSELSGTFTPQRLPKKMVL